MVYTYKTVPFYMRPITLEKTRVISKRMVILAETSHSSIGSHDVAFAVQKADEGYETLIQRDTKMGTVI